MTSLIRGRGGPGEGSAERLGVGSGVGVSDEAGVDTVGEGGSEAAGDEMLGSDRSAQPANAPKAAPAVAVSTARRVSTP